ncbi:N-formylglutamate amidohydrolase [Sulfitobacter alexandrii]|uniref:N-formylglutamate amidohydrolase n=1 Tax=Sulfitobacter alexandrii TaxID=1917485 RepID=A0A1J0WEC5_9RHOB|nr:N-formylglutamate amidohydrolase [Sulfitobacter alexandrii]APE42510.1 N-formylglutamate amidohydrolase [Sulfitobacter alexandrii]
MGRTTDHAEAVGVAEVNPSGTSSIVLICEHASHHIPDDFKGLGLAPDALQSHAAWDPGAMAVAERLSARLDAKLLAGTVSRLVYDLNRPPDAPGAMPEQSEVFAVPGNRDLTQAARAERAARYYQPFHDRIEEVMAVIDAPILVTVHSFTPVFLGQRRAVEIGVLHDADSRLADAMLACAEAHTQSDVQRNAPYGPQDGVMHTLHLHGIAQDRLNVMLEIRNDLIGTADDQDRMAQMIAGWLADACARLGAGERVSCVA